MLQMKGGNIAQKVREVTKKWHKEEMGGDKRVHFCANALGLAESVWISLSVTD